MTCQLLLCLTQSNISLKHHVQTQRWILLLFVLEFKIFITDTQYFLALQKGSAQRSLASSKDGVKLKKNSIF